MYKWRCCKCPDLYLYLYQSFTYISVVHVNVRSLYIVDWMMVVVEGGNVLHHVKIEGH